MNDVKLNQLSLVKGSGSAASPSSPDSRQAAVAAQRPTIQITEHNVSSRAPADVDSAGQQQELKDAVTKLNDYVQTVQRDLSFELDESTGKTVITVIDRKTQEVVRQIPDEVALRLARNLQQDEPVSLFNMKV